jgi:hypothetical protein
MRDPGRLLMKAFEKSSSLKRHEAHIGIIDIPCVLNTPLYDAMKLNILVVYLDQQNRVFSFNTTSGCIPRLYRTYDAALREFTNEMLVVRHKSISVFTPGTALYDFVLEQIVIFLSRVSPGIIKC